MNLAIKTTHLAAVQAAIAKPSEARPYLQGFHLCTFKDDFHGSTSWAVGTDGHILVAAPVTVLGGELDPEVSVFEPVKLNRAGHNRDRVTWLHTDPASEDKDHRVLRALQTPGSQGFPSWTRLVDTGAPGSLPAIAFDPQILARVAKAIACRGDDSPPIAKLTFGESERDLMRVRFHDEPELLCVFMPCRP